MGDVNQERQGVVFLSDEAHPLSAADVESLRQQGCDVILTNESGCAPDEQLWRSHAV
jgi:hypothetical protein